MVERARVRRSPPQHPRDARPRPAPAAGAAGVGHRSRAQPAPRRGAPQGPGRAQQRTGVAPQPRPPAPLTTLTRPRRGRGRAAARPRRGPAAAGPCPPAARRPRPPRPPGRRTGAASRAGRRQGAEPRGEAVLRRIGGSAVARTVTTSSAPSTRANGSPSTPSSSPSSATTPTAVSMPSVTIESPARRRRSGRVRRAQGPHDERGVRAPERPEAGDPERPPEALGVLDPQGGDEQHVGRHRGHDGRAAERPRARAIGAQPQRGAGGRRAGEHAEPQAGGHHAPVRVVEGAGEQRPDGDERREAEAAHERPAGEPAPLCGVARGCEHRTQGRTAALKRDGARRGGVRAGRRLARPWCAPPAQRAVARSSSACSSLSGPMVRASLPARTRRM